jgi:membrane protein
VYYSAQIFLLGAEFTWVYAHSHGSRQGQALPPQETPSRTNDNLPARPSFEEPDSQRAKAPPRLVAREADRPPQAENRPRQKRS